MPEEKEPPGGIAWFRWRLEDISARLGKTDDQVRAVREDVAEMKGDVRGMSKKLDGICARMTTLRDEVEGHQKAIALNAARAEDLGKAVADKVPREVCRQEMGKVSMFMKVFLFMIGGLLIAAAVKTVLGG
jgi:uncharacterized protein YgbK (DUF1537 family)